MFLFVYGTLRRGAEHPMHGPLRAASSLVGDARIRGALHRIDGYPALRLDAREDWVRGEVYELHDPAVLTVLDDYECMGPSDPEPHEFRRVHGSVTLDGGRDLVAWIYEYAWPLDGRPRITSGDFLRRP